MKRVAAGRFVRAAEPEPQLLASIGLLPDPDPLRVVGRGLAGRPAAC